MSLKLIKSSFTKIFSTLITIFSLISINESKFYNVYRLRISMLDKINEISLFVTAFKAFDHNLAD